MELMLVVGAGVGLIAIVAYATHNHTGLYGDKYTYIPLKREKLMTIQTFEKVKNHITAIKFEGGRESGMAVAKFVGSGSYIPVTSENPRDYVRIPTMIGPRQLRIGEWAAKIDNETVVHYKEKALFAEYLLVTDEESRIVQHARAELAKFVNEDADFIESCMAAVKGFASYKGHSGSSAAIAIEMISALLRGQNLLPLTGDPEEWTHHDAKVYGASTDMWQNKRNNAAFAEDGTFKRYFLVSDPLNEDQSRIWYDTEAKDFTPEPSEEDLAGEPEVNL